MKTEETLLEEPLADSVLADDNVLEGEIKFVFQCLGTMKQLREERINNSLIEKNSFWHKFSEAVGIR